jgi:hypothetical protein
VPDETTTETVGGGGSVQYHCDSCGNDFEVEARLIEDVNPATGEPTEEGHPGQGIEWDSNVTCPACGSSNVVRA